MQVTTFKVRTVRSMDGVYTNPVATWLHGMDNDLDSIAGSQQELLNKALSQANTSGGTRESLCQPRAMHAPALYQTAPPVTLKLKKALHPHVYRAGLQKEKDACWGVSGLLDTSDV